MEFRLATRADVPVIVALIADDDVTRARGFLSTEVEPAHWSAFEAIDADPRNELVVAVDGDEIVGTCQLTYLPGLTRGGRERVQIEGVRVAAARRGSGVGRAMIRWALERARARGCTLAQLTTDKIRVDAQRFYRDLGFTGSHEGMKLEL